MGRPLNTLFRQFERDRCGEPLESAKINNGILLSVIYCSDPIEEDYEQDERRNKGTDHEHSDIETGDENSQQLAPLSQRHSQSNSEVMQSSTYAQPNRRGSTTGVVVTNNALVAHPFNPGSNGNNHLSTTGNELVLSRRPSAVLTEILSTRRPSALMAALTRPHQQYRPQQQRLNMMEIREGQVLGSTRTLNMGGHHNGPECPEAKEFKRRNRRIGEWVVLINRPSGPRC